MADKSELEKTVEYAIGGIPQLKPDEKRKWLGEFRERVILGLTMDQAYKSEAKDYIKNALNDSMAEIIIVNQKIPMDIVSKYMKLAKDTDKEFKTVMTNNEDAMGIVVVSRKAVERENVEVDFENINKNIKDANSKETSHNNEKSTTMWSKLRNIFRK